MRLVDAEVGVRSSAEAGKRAGPPRCLLVVDGPILARLVDLLLDHGLYSRRTVSSVRNARHELDEWQPHLAIVSLDITAGDPLALIGAARQSGARLPVIAISLKRDMETQLRFPSARPRLGAAISAVIDARYGAA